MEQVDKHLEFAKENKNKFILDIIKDKTPVMNKEAIFMAGSPGAGKTEVVSSLTENYSNYVVIDADYFRTQFPGYNGKNSSLFQKGSSWLVEQALRYVLENGYSFILDATFAILSADKNIKRALKNEYSISIFYVYQQPEIAWNFTKKREKVEGRLVPKEIFINAFFKSRENIEKVKERYPEIMLNIIVKDYQNNISETHFSADNIELFLPLKYTREELEEHIHE
ncbi:zeta toxin family protein [Vagococcus fluvialis]|uniref:zeta toxin family protein n=1 Tax=Vagococcus fluvialis TaxID=2738 RepID=UPI003B598E22